MNRRAGVERKAIVRFIRFRSQQAETGMPVGGRVVSQILAKLALAIEAGAHNDLKAPEPATEYASSIWITPEGNAFTVAPVDRESQLYVHSGRLEDALTNAGLGDAMLREAKSAALTAIDRMEHAERTATRFSDELGQREAELRFAKDEVIRLKAYCQKLTKKLEIAGVEPPW